jgi:hypothetical protein
MRTTMPNAVDFDCSRIEIAEIQQAPDQRRLAGAVYTRQTHAFPRENLKIDSAQYFGAPKALVHSAESNQWLGHCRQALPPGCVDDSAKTAHFHEGTAIARKR